MFVDHHPEIKFSDFDEMRAHYKDYLRSKNLSDGAIEGALTDFDIARWGENYDQIYEKMTSIGVILVEE